MQRLHVRYSKPRTNHANPFTYNCICCQDKIHDVGVRSHCALTSFSSSWKIPFNTMCCTKTCAPNAQQSKRQDKRITHITLCAHAQPQDKHKSHAHTHTHIHTHTYHTRTHTRAHTHTHTHKCISTHYDQQASSISCTLQRFTSAIACREES